MQTQQRHEIRVTPAPAEFDYVPGRRRRRRGHRQRVLTPRPGMKTTEFWATLVAVAAMLAATAATEDVWIRVAGWMFVAVIVSAYAISRGLAKLGRERTDPTDRPT
jgi:hypothetical protein